MKKILTILIALVLVLSLSSCLDTRSSLPYQSFSTYEQMRLDMLSEVMPAVIIVKTESGHGSGLIYHQEDDLYYAITNQHVVEDGGEMQIQFGSSRQPIPVEDVASNALYDVAVVRFRSNVQLPVYYSKIINDEVIIQIMVGQDVYAVGTPEDISRYNYVTQGVVSMASYPYKGIDNLGIMHDAELNPGNSGGPLFNLNGDFIGINVAKIPNISTSDGIIPAEGLNYSLNVNEIYFKFIRTLSEEDFQVIERRPRLGVTVQNASVYRENPESDLSKIPADLEGVVVIGLDPSRDAINYLKEFDFIIKMNGVNISSVADIGAQLSDAKFGDTHVITVLRFVQGAFVEMTYTITLR
jgi:S1-C subfamily serine protease